MYSGRYMARLKISQAAKIAGVSRATIHKHIKAGKLSVSMREMEAG